jgi:hypothetical protein
MTISFQDLSGAPTGRRNLAELLFFYLTGLQKQPIIGSSASHGVTEGKGSFLGRCSMIDKLGQLAEHVATRLTRRGFLGRVAAVAAGTAALLTGGVATAAGRKWCLYKVRMSNCNQVPVGSVLCLPCPPTNPCKAFTKCTVTVNGVNCTVTVKLIATVCKACPTTGIKPAAAACA